MILSGTGNMSSAAVSIPFRGTEEVGVAFWGAYTTGTVVLEMSPDGGTTWLTLKSAAAKGTALQAVFGTQLRATMSGNTGNQAWNVSIFDPRL